MRRDQRLHLCEHRLVAAQGQLVVDALGERRETLVVEPRRVVLRERAELDVGERRAAPEGERLGERLHCGCGWLACARATSAPNRALSRASGETCTEYPGERVTITAPSLRRSCQTYVATSFAARGGGSSPQSSGYAGADRLVGGPGNDVLYAGAGRDVIVCGRGRDTAWADATDRIAADCEVVRRPVVAAKVLRRGPLVAGTYVSATSLPRVRLTVGAGWQVSGYGHGEEFTLTRAFTDWVALGRQGGSVDDAVGQLSTVGTVTAGPAATRVGGLTGKRFDLAGPSTNTTPFPGSFFLQDGDSARVWALDRRGRTLTIVVKARTADFPAYTALVQQVLGSFVFQP